MTGPAAEDCTVYYYPRLIVLKGASARVHIEAHRILRRFAASATPYRVVEDHGEHMILGTQPESGMA